MVFSITIDCHEDGRLEVWSQVKDTLKEADRKKLQILKERVKALIKEAKQLTLIEN